MMQVGTDTDDKPEMLTIPELEKKGILPGRAIRRLIAEGKILTISVGNRKYVNYTHFCKQLQNCEGDLFIK